MRLWSLHPSQLDGKGLVARWREGLLALAVLEGKTRCYRHHPQLARFAACRRPAAVVASYLRAVCDETRARGFAFDHAKLGPARARTRLPVTRGQLDHEWRHLLRKLYRRDRVRWARQRGEAPLAHRMFEMVPGPVAPWERPREARAAVRTERGGAPRSWRRGARRANPRRIRPTGNEADGPAPPATRPGVVTPTGSSACRLRAPAPAPLRAPPATRRGAAHPPARQPRAPGARPV